MRASGKFHFRPFAVIQPKFVLTHCRLGGERPQISVMRSIWRWVIPMLGLWSGSVAAAARSDEQVFVCAERASASCDRAARCATDAPNRLTRQQWRFDLGKTGYEQGTVYEGKYVKGIGGKILQTLVSRQDPAYTVTTLVLGEVVVTLTPKFDRALGRTSGIEGLLHTGRAGGVFLSWLDCRVEDQAPS